MKDKEKLRNKIVTMLNDLSASGAIDSWTVALPGKDRYRHIEPFCDYILNKGRRELCIKVIEFENLPAIAIEDDSETASIVKLGKGLETISEVKEIIKAA